MSLFDKLERNQERVYEAGARRARQASDDELRRYNRSVQQSGNKIGQEIARKEMDRRGL